MQIIPVIDLQAGIVVHARAGNRKHYQAVKSDLCSSSDLFKVIAGLLNLYPFRCCYIADLDAITGKGNHTSLIQRLLKQYPTIEFMIDAGFGDGFFSRQYPVNYLPIIGSEGLINEHLPLLNKHRQGPYILSLDYTLTENLGPESLFIDSKYWPKQIISMPLANVGSSNGPDWPRLQQYRNNYPNYSIIAAGGVRNLADLQKLKLLGINAVLVASALHSATINHQDIQAIEDSGKIK